MPLKKLPHPVYGSVKMGADLSRIREHRALKFRDYRSSFAPPAPASVNYMTPALGTLRLTLGNDQLGDCVIAWMLHCAAIFTAAAGSSVAFTTAQAIALYSAITGYVPGDESTDQGTDPIAALNYWQKNGVGESAGHPMIFVTGAHKITGHIAIDATNPEEIKQAAYLFENVMVCIALPDEWVNPMPSASGFVWDVAGPSVPENGHCFGSAAYGDAPGLSALGVRADGSLVIDSWGMFGNITHAALAMYATNGGALYSVLSQDSINRAKAKAPNGYDWAQLEADFAAMAG